MTEQQLLDEMERTGALLKGHFLLSSGKHSTRYLQCARLLQHPSLSGMIGEALARMAAERRLEVDVVAAPAIGGIVVGHEVARALGARSIFSEREAGEMTFRRGLGIDRTGEKVLAVEDVVTTGGSVKETIAAARAAGGDVVGVASIVDRSGGNAGFDVPFISLLQVNFPVYDPDKLPPELQNSTPVKPGSRAFTQ